jgi:hypothetical protein
MDSRFRGNERIGFRAYRFIASSAFSPTVRPGKPALSK